MVIRSMVAGLNLDCSRLPTQVTIVHGRRLAIGPILFRTYEALVTTYTVKFEHVAFQRGDEWINFVGKLSPPANPV